MSAAGLCGLWLLLPGALSSRPGVEVAQPVPFSHRVHVQEEGLDCRLCHAAVERSAFAGMPSTQVCMGCHGAAWDTGTGAATLKEAWLADRPIAWARVHRLPDFVYFNHAVHVGSGVGCVTCHGRVDEMASVQQVSPLTMGWCLDCHRDPAPHLRPPEHVVSMTWTAPAAAAAPTTPDVHPRTDCSTCHR